MKLHNLKTTKWLMAREHYHMKALNHNPVCRWNKKQIWFRQAHQGVIDWANGVNRHVR